MNSKGFVFAALLAGPVLFSAQAAYAQAAPADQSATTSEAKDDPTICKVDRATGSRIRVNRTCMKRSQWDEMQRNIRSGINQVGQNGRGPSTMGSMGPGSN